MVTEPTASTAETAPAAGITRRQLLVYATATPTLGVAVRLAGDLGLAGEEAELADAQVAGIVDFTDFMAGFVKSFVFAILIAGIGCLRGLQTAAGASAVGDAATRAVVSGIILLVVVDGVFAVIYFVLDI